MPDGRVLTMADAMREMRNDQGFGHDDQTSVTLDVEVDHDAAPPELD